MSLFDEIPSPAGCTYNLPEPGLLVMRIDTTPVDADTDSVSHVYTPDHHHSVDIECASGMRDGSGRFDPFEGVDHLDSIHAPADTGDVFTPLNGNTFATYSNPNTRGFPTAPASGHWKRTVRSKFNLVNIRYDEDEQTMLADFVFPSFPSTYDTSRVTVDTEWSGHMDLVGDVAVDNSATLSASPGTTIKMRENYDSEGSGSDATRTEIRIRSGGDINIQASQASPVTFASAASAPDSADWFGINVLTGGSIRLRYCDVAHGQYGIYADEADPSTFALQHSGFHRNHFHGVKVRALKGSFRVDTCAVYDNGYSGIYLQKNKGLTASPSVRTYFTGSSIYGNSTVMQSFDLELVDNGGTGEMRDTLKYSTIGGAIDPANPTYGGVCLGSDYDTGNHRAFVDSTTVQHYPASVSALAGLYSEGMPLVRVHWSWFKSSAFGVAGTVSNVRVDSTSFAGSNAAHVWNDTASVMCLGDSANAIPGGNAFHKVTVAGDTMIFNYDTAAIKAEYNWWETQVNCQPPPPKFFHGHVDSLPRICSAPNPARPIPGEDPFSVYGEAQEQALRLIAFPNPSTLTTVFHYVLPGSPGCGQDVGGCAKLS